MQSPAESVATMSERAWSSGKRLPWLAAGVGVRFLLNSQASEGWVVKVHAEVCQVVLASADVGDTSKMFSLAISQLSPWLCDTRGDSFMVFEGSYVGIKGKIVGFDMTVAYIQPEVEKKKKQNVGFFAGIAGNSLLHVDKQCLAKFNPQWINWLKAPGHHISSTTGQVSAHAALSVTQHAMPTPMSTGHAARSAKPEDDDMQCAKTEEADDPPYRQEPHVFSPLTAGDETHVPSLSRERASPAGMSPAFSQRGYSPVAAPVPLGITPAMAAGAVRSPGGTPMTPMPGDGSPMQKVKLQPGSSTPMTPMPGGLTPPVPTPSQDAGMSPKADPSEADESKDRGASTSAQESMKDSWAQGKGELPETDPLAGSSSSLAQVKGEAAFDDDDDIEL